MRLLAAGALASSVLVSACAGRAPSDRAIELEAAPPAPIAQTRALWVPGHWRKVPRGFVWIEGHWA